MADMMIEFLDNEWYYDTEKPTLSEPWRTEYPFAVELKLSTVEKFGQKTRYKYIALNDGDIVEELVSNIKLNGLMKPVVLMVDNYSNAALYDGHHRIIALQKLNYVNVPVLVEQCEMLRVDSKPVFALIKELC